MTTNLLCFLVIFGSNLLLCCTKPVLEWHTSSAEDTGKFNLNFHACTFWLARQIGVLLDLFISQKGNYIL